MEVDTAPAQLPRRRLHSVKDVCAGGHISHATAWRLIGRNVLKTVKIGRRTFITDESFERLVTEGAPKIGEAAA
jgi:hypothetical protein